MDKDKRKPRAYKVRDEFYLKAIKKCEKPLATFLEDVVIAIASDRKVTLDEGSIKQEINDAR